MPIPAVNYGGIGAVIGHEMSHQFDDQGAKYDLHGNLVGLVDSGGREELPVAARQDMSEQINSYEPLPGMHVNGKLTMGENVADLAGLTVAHDAYIASLNGAAAAGDRRDHRRPALLSRLGAGVAAQLSRGGASAAAADQSAFAVPSSAPTSCATWILGTRRSTCSRGRSCISRQRIACASGRMTRI